MIIYEKLTTFKKLLIVILCTLNHSVPTQYRPRMLGSCARSRTYMRKADITKIKIDGNTIKEVSETKFLGVIIDNRLSWIPHIENLYKKT